MDAQEITLHIAANLGRIGRWTLEKKESRVIQFLNDTQDYLNELERLPRRKSFEPTYNTFKKIFKKLKSSPKLDQGWVEDILTWANILTHRAKLA